MQILMAASECTPFAKAGGLADVVFSLSKALAELRMRTTVMLPWYRSSDLKSLPVKSIENLGVLETSGPLQLTADLVRVTLKTSPVSFILVNAPTYFDRKGIYDDPKTGEGYIDQGERYLAFSTCVAQFVADAEEPIDLVHLHDNHVGPAAAYLKRLDNPPRIIFHIHNLAYQGNYDAKLFPLSGLPERMMWAEGEAEYYGEFSFMKLGILSADEVVTVSPRYAEEVLSGPEFGCGMEDLLAAKMPHFHGILNGIDPGEWDPETDPLIPYHYSIDDLSGKARSKRVLRKAFSLPTPLNQDTPVMGMITRLAEQKGIDLLLDVMGEIMALPIQMVILGEGRLKYQKALKSLRRRHPDKLGLYLGYDNRLAHLIEAGANLFLMPSIYEPCGLNQLYSLRYGTLPIVSRVGGLQDTVRPLNEDGSDGWGFTFKLKDAEDLLETIKEALFVYRRKRIWRSAMLRAMSLDFTWNASARAFLELYGKEL